MAAMSMAASNAAGSRAAWSVTPTGAERQHRLPVIQHWLFEPRFALQRRRNPIGAIKHFARHLRVAGFIGADQAKRPEAIEEKESAERRQQQNVGAGSRIRSLFHLPLAGRPDCFVRLSFANGYRPTTDRLVRDRAQRPRTTVSACRRSTIRDTATSRGPSSEQPLAHL